MTPSHAEAVDTVVHEGGDALAAPREWLLMRTTELVNRGEVNDAQATVLAQLIHADDDRVWAALETYRFLCETLLNPPDHSASAFGAAGTTAGSNVHGLLSPETDLNDTLTRLASLELTRSEAANEALSAND